ncbi:prolyl oligopeptidase family serine peptidase [soil metagenome]
MSSMMLCMALLGAGLFVGPGTANADSVNWSGLDARFYDGPISAPGELINSVPLDPALSVTGAANAYRILYSTLDQVDAPAVSTAAVFVPRAAPPEGGWPVLAWAHGTVGLADECTPSALPRSQRDDEYLSHWLDQGYAIVATDYVGLGTPGLMAFLDNVVAAHGVIDSVVAAHHLDLPLSPKWGIVGQSQGGSAAVNSARWATEFSQGANLNYRGVVATGTPANVERAFIAAGPDFAISDVGPYASAYTAYILAGLRSARPDLGIDTVLSPAGLDAVGRVKTVCVDAFADELANLTPGEFFTAPLDSIPGMSGALHDYMTTPTSGYDRPLFLGVGLQDHDVPPVSTLTLYDQLVANKQEVELRVYPDQDHTGTVLASMVDSTPFLQRVFGPR